MIKIRSNIKGAAVKKKKMNQFLILCEEAIEWLMPYDAAETVRVIRG